MDKVLLQARVRNLAIKMRDLRSDSRLPAVVYGQGNNLVLDLDYEEVRKAYIKAGETTVVELDVDGKKYPVLFKSLQFHPISDKIWHVDFYEVDMKAEITAYVPVHIIGEAPAVKDLQGTLMHQLHEVEVRCLPDRIPHEFEVDVAALVDFNSAIHVSDIVVPEGVELITDPELTIATVTAPRAEEPADDVDPAEAEAAAIAEAAGEEAGGEEGAADSE